MDIDISVIAAGLTGFFIFLTVHIFSFRYTDKNKSVYRICQLFIVSFLIGSGAGYALLLYLLKSNSGTIFPVASVGYILIVALSAAVYIAGIFQMAYASLHLEIIRKIAGFHKKGVSKRRIKKILNKNTIVKKRLERLIDCGELVFSGGKFKYGKRRSPLLWREKFSTFVHRLFP